MSPDFFDSVDAENGNKIGFGNRGYPYKFGLCIRSTCCPSCQYANNCAAKHPPEKEEIEVQTWWCSTTLWWCRIFSGQDREKRVLFHLVQYKRVVKKQGIYLILQSVQAEFESIKSLKYQWSYLSIYFPILVDTTPWLGEERCCVLFFFFSCINFH